MAECKIPLPFEVSKLARELGMNVRVARKRRRMLQGELHSVGWIDAVR
mgnify:CR=1 FL=1